MKSLKLARFYILFIVLSTSATSINAKTIHYVKADGTGDGSSWATAAGNIQTMIDKSVSGDEVWVAKGTYYPTTETIARDARSRTFLLKDGVNTYGGFAGTETAISQRALSDLDGNGRVDPWEFVNTTLLSGDIDGVADVWTKTMNSDGKTWKWTVTGNEGNCYNVVTGGSSTASFDGFSIIGGNANISSIWKGGGIYAQSAVVTNCTVSNCSASRGGGIYAAYSSSVTNCTVSNCSASTNGGGIFADSSVTNCTVSNCSASTNGGGIYAAYSSSVTNCTVSNCSVSSDGGGIYAAYSSVTNCTVSNCSASANGYSGGIYAYFSSVTNCTVSTCSASSGGGIYASSSSIINCTVSNCSASTNGGGVYASSYSSSVINCTVSNCSASNGGGIYASSVANCTVNNCSASTNGGGIYASSVTNCAVSNNKVGTSASNISGGETLSGNISPDIQVAFVNPTSFVGVAVTDAQKAELLTADWHLRKGSPCINAGTSTNVNSSILNGNDFDGNPRVQCGTIDIGAYEYIIPAISMHIVENFNDWTNFDNSNVLYNSATINGGQNIKWIIENQKTVFSWKTNLTTTYSQPFFTYRIDATQSTKVFLRYDMFFQAYAGTITPLGTEKLNVEFSTDLIAWTSIAIYSNLSGTIDNKNYLHDISTLAAGKTFYIRFNANGANSNRIEKWEIDNIIISSDATTAVNQIKENKFSYYIKNGELAIHNLDTGTSVQIYDMNGKLLNSENAASQTVYYNLPARGVYLVKVSAGSEIENKKVVW